MRVEWLGEPRLLFDLSQTIEDPRDGLTLFGPLDSTGPLGIRVGAIGTRIGIEAFRKWSARVQHPILGVEKYRVARPPFPGFEAAFKVPWPKEPIITVEIDAAVLQAALMNSDPNLRVYEAVTMFASPIRESTKREDVRPDVWFVILPNDVKRYCRPNSTVPLELQRKRDIGFSPKYGRTLIYQRPLFEADTAKAEPYFYESNFHNQLKARLLDLGVTTQIVQEGTLTSPSIADRAYKTYQVMEPSIAWNLCSAAYYKVGGRPWKLAAGREDVCYIGLVFKQDNRSADVSNACCAAQMFLDSGDGLVFRGNIGPWYNPKKGDFHLDERAANDLIGRAISDYTAKKSRPPKELFIHGRVGFSDEEWSGFCRAAGTSTKLVGVRIDDSRNLKIFRHGKSPALRGLGCFVDSRTAYLVSNGFVPRLRTYPGLEVPNPLYIQISRGESDMKVVLNDILALTKLNYNTCIFADRNPVTLKFADRIGEILTAGPEVKDPPKQFRHYI